MTRTSWTLTTLIAAGLILSGQPAGSQTAEAKAKASVSVVTDTTPARELETFSDDIRLTNQCIDRGGKKTECVCLTQVLKYELNVGDYRRAARGWTVPASVSSEASMRPADLRSVTQASDFGERCDMARAYFKPGLR